MAKKSSPNRQRQASQARSGAPSKTQATSARQMSSATLVRTTKQDAVTPASDAETPSSPSAASIVRDTPATPRKSGANATTPAKAATATTPAAKAPAPAAKPAPAPTAVKRQDTRVARARATQRARQAGLISAENYSYVLGDLKLVAALAIGAFAILIALTFILPR